MDMIKIGAFLKQLRKEHALTQAQLADKLMVTNKTVSRWENGNYLPNVEMLKLISELYGVTINEILCGERLNPEQYMPCAENVITDVLKSSTFTLKDKIAFWKKRWYKNNWLLIVVTVIIYAILLTYGLIKSNIIIVRCSSLYGVVVYLVGYNRMMAYVEKNAY